MRITKITIINHSSKAQNINDLLLAFGNNLGLFGLRDRDKSCYRIFIVLVKALKLKLELTSDEIALQTGLTRGTIVHHLNNLMDAGIVTNYRNKYFIDVDNLTELVKDMRKNVDGFFNNLAVLADRIDEDLKLK